MKPAWRCVAAALLSALLLASLPGNALADGHDATLEHVVIVWLKEPGNAGHRSRIIEESRVLATIPGVLSLKSGSVVQSDRAIVDSSFDVALVISLADRDALDAYLLHPVHVKLVEETLEPLVARIQVYDFR